jgi:maleylpyruvate isomerase
VNQSALKLYSYWRSSSCYRVRIALAYKQLDYTYVAVDLRVGQDQQHTRDFARKNPLHQVPVLELDGGGTPVRLAQSVAILEFLEESFRELPLLPQDTIARAGVRQAVEIVNSGIQPLHNLASLNALTEFSPEFPKQAWLDRFIADGLAALEALAVHQGGRFSVGDDVTLADIYLIPQLYVARRFRIPLRAYPKLLAMEAQCLRLEAFRSAAPEVQPDTPDESLARPTPTLH